MNPSSIQILKAAADLPVAQARRVVDALLAKDSAQPQGMEDLRAALREDLVPVGHALANAYKAGDGAAMMAALRKISAKMPELSGDAQNLSHVLSLQLLDSFLKPVRPSHA